MITEQDLLRIVTERLESEGILYMITGSVAANFYTTPRMTRDIDVVIEIDHQATERFLSLFSEDFVIDREQLISAVRQQTLFNIIHQESVIKVDLIVRKSTEYRELEFRRRRSIEFEGMRLSVVSPEDLILSKLSWAQDNLSDMQLNDVRNLLRTVDELDHNYIQEWVAKLGLQEVYQAVRS